MDVDVDQPREKEPTTSVNHRIANGQTRPLPDGHDLTPVNGDTTIDDESVKEQLCVRNNEIDFQPETPECARTRINYYCVQMTCARK